MKILVTGGAGFVGRHICKRFTDLENIVICVDNLISESSKNLNDWPEHLKCNNNLEFINKDCRNYFKNEGKNEKFDLVIHLAAVVGGRCVIENSPIAVAEDLAIDSEMFNWAVKSKPKKIVFFSSSAAYPIKYQTDNINEQKKLEEEMINFENDLGMADLTYGWAKLTGEYLARMAHQKYGLDIVCYRPMSGYGEDQDICYPFPGIINRVLKKENPIEIWSDSIRDFIYIEDCVDCLIQTMDTVHDGTAINMGTGKPTSFSNLVKKMCIELGHENAEIKILDDKPKGVYYRVGDMAKCAKLGYKYKTSLEEGISITANYLKNIHLKGTIYLNENLLIDNIFHNFEYLPGKYSNPRLPEIKPKEVLKMYDIDINSYFKNKRVLDIGGFTGMYSFIIEELGAKEIIVADIQPSNKTGFDKLKTVRKSKCKYYNCSVYNLDPEIHGKFDVILFFGLHYHLKNPLLAIAKVGSLCNENTEIFCSGTTADINIHSENNENDTINFISMGIDNYPISVFYKDKFLGDDSNWFIPTSICLQRWWESEGFTCLLKSISHANHHGMVNSKFMKTTTMLKLKKETSDIIQEQDISTYNWCN